MLICDDNRRCRAANRAAGLLFRLAPQEVAGLRIDDLTPLELRGELEGRWRDFLREGTQRGTFPMLMPDGPTMLVDYRATANVEPGRHLGLLLIPRADPGCEDGEAPAAQRRLSERERDVLALIATGRSGAAIAGSLGISPTTVETHVRHCLTKLGARNRAHAIAIGLHLGEIDIDLVRASGE